MEHDIGGGGLAYIVKTERRPAVKHDIGYVDLAYVVNLCKILAEWNGNGEAGPGDLISPPLYKHGFLW